MGKKALRGAREIIDRWKVDYDFKTFINSFGSTLITFFFALFKKPTVMPTFLIIVRLLDVFFMN